MANVGLRMWIQREEEGLVVVSYRHAAWPTSAVSARVPVPHPPPPHKPAHLVVIPIPAIAAHVAAAGAHLVAAEGVGEMGQAVWKAVWQARMCVVPPACCRLLALAHADYCRLLALAHCRPTHQDVQLVTAHLEQVLVTASSPNPGLQ